MSDVAPTVAAWKAIRPNRRRYEIGMLVLTGWTPWGRALPGVPRPVSSRSASRGRGRRSYPLCCGCVLSATEVEAWRSAGLLAFGPVDEHGVTTYQAGPSLERWVSWAWHGLKAARWPKAERPT